MKLISNLIETNSGKADFREILKGSSTSFIFRVIGLGCAQLFSFIVARYMGAEAWGAFSLALSIVLIGSILGTLGLDIGMLKKVAGDKDKSLVFDLYQKAFWLAFGASVCISILFYCGAAFIAEVVFSKPDLEVFFKLAALGITPLSLIKLNSEVLRGLKKISRYAFIYYVGRYLFALLFLPLLWIFFTQSVSVLIAFTGGLYILWIVSQIWVHWEKTIFSDLENNNQAAPVKKLLKISLPLLLASSLVFIKGWIDTIMVGIFLSGEQVGIYFLALKLATVLSIILSAVNVIAAPKFSEAYSNFSQKKLEQIVQQSTRLIFFTTLPFLIIFLIFPEQILALFGSEFRTGATALTLLSLGNFVNATAGSVGYFMQMTESQVAFQNITLITTFLGIGLNYWLIPIMGIEGAALSTFIGLVFWNVACAMFIKRNYNLSTYYIPFLK